MKILGGITAVVILMVYCAMLNGWALVKLWAWFIVPTFGSPPLSIPAAIGLAMVVGYLTQHEAKSDDVGFVAELIKLACYATFKPLFALAFGLVVKAWM